MAYEDIGNRATIGYYIPPESPISAKVSFQQVVICAGWLSVHRVISAHYGTGLPVYNGHAERRQIGVFHVVLRHRHVDSMAGQLRSAVNCEVLRRSNRL